MIDEAAARGADLTQHLLAFARKQPLQPREIDINTLIIDTAKLLRPTLGEQIEIESVFDDEACIATVDPNQLATAILNLCAQRPRRHAEWRQADPGNRFGLSRRELSPACNDESGPAATR